MECNPEGAFESRIAYLDQRVAQLEAGLHRAARAANSLGRAAGRRGPNRAESAEPQPA